MREIKFRLFDGQQMNDVHFTNLELLQFSGLKDKNGKEIYEGDIVEYDIRAIWKGVQVSKLWEVYFDKDELKFLGKNNSPIQTISLTKECKIIGNIYQHPELIKNGV